MKYLFPVLFFILCIGQARAQKRGVSIGSGPYLSYCQPVNQHLDPNYLSTFGGYSLGYSFELGYYFNKELALFTGVGLTASVWGYTARPNTAYSVNHAQQVNTIDLPVFIRYVSGSKTGFYLNAGYRLGISTAAKTWNDREREVDNRQYFTKALSMITAGGGLNFITRRRNDICFGPELCYQLNDCYRNSDQHYGYFRIGLSGRFYFNQHQKRDL